MAEPEIQTPHGTGNSNDKMMPLVVYILYLTGFVVGITPVIGVIMAYINRGTAPAWLQTHYSLQIRTFWIGLLLSIIGAITALIFIGWLVLLATAIWFIARCVKGLMHLQRGEAYPDPATWLL
ncbi:MAG: DUF4870 family protein [Pseudomonadota bacterium]